MADLIGQQLGQYEILNLIGEGGMAAVYRARQQSMARDVAVKVIESRQTRSADFTKRFEREARTVASLSHPHILKVFDYGQQGDLVYLVMELLRGGSVADLIRRSQLTLKTTESILDQIASALDYAHTQGIIHRDLKPQNVLLDDLGHAYLTDFGIAKIFSETTVLTQTGAAMGTPAYMPPEQWQGQTLDARADIYSVGVMLFEMLSGKLPFEADTPYSMMHMHINKALPPIHEVRPDLPAGVEQVLAAATAKNRDERYSSAAELSAAFKAALAGAKKIPKPSRLSVGPDSPTIVELPTLAGSKARRSIFLGVGAIAIALLLIGMYALLTGTLPPTFATVTVQAAAIASTVTPVSTQPVSHTPTWTPTLSPTQTSAPPTPTITAIPSQTPTTEPNPQTRAAATFAERARMTANAVASSTKTSTSDQEATTQAIVAATDTAIAIASFTWTPLPTATFTKTPTATRTSTLTPVPTDTPLPTLMPLPTATAYTAPLVASPIPALSCPGAMPSRLQIGMTVVYNSKHSSRVRLGVRDTPGRQQGQLLAVFNPDQYPLITLLEGPRCIREQEGNWVWWKVRVPDSGIIGWAIESTTETYYMCISRGSCP